MVWVSLNSMPITEVMVGWFKTTDLRIKQKISESFTHSRKSKYFTTIITNPLLNDHEDYESSIEGFLRDERIGQITHLPENRVMN